MAGLLACCALLGGCERAMQDMYEQPKLKPFAATSIFPDGAVNRPLPAGTVPQVGGPFADSSGGRTGDPLPLAQPNKPPLTAALLARGRDRYTLFCEPCHSPAGDGDGIIVRRGFPHPPTYHSDALRTLDDERIYDVITQGYGAMYSYAARVPPLDRWAIVAYLRALQISQHVPVARLPPQDRAKLPGGAP